MGDVIDFKSKVKTTDDGPEELCCPDCGCDTFRLDTVGFYCVGCYQYLVAMVCEEE
jgi:hypothetical protein